MKIHADKRVFGWKAESQQKTNIASELEVAGIEKDDSLDKVSELWKALSVSVRINRFINNCRKTKEVWRQLVKSKSRKGFEIGESSSDSEIKQKLRLTWKV